MHSKFSTLWMICNAYDDMSNFSVRSKHQRCYRKDTQDLSHNIGRWHLSKSKSIDFLYKNITTEHTQSFVFQQNRNLYSGIVNWPKLEIYKSKWQATRQFGNLMEVPTIHFQTSGHDSNLYQVEFIEPHNPVQQDREQAKLWSNFEWL